jgi:hypothetical protein
VALGIQDMPSSNFDRDIDYTDRLFILFFSPSRKIPGEYLKLGYDHFFPHPYPFITHTSPITPCYIVPVTDNNVKQVQINEQIKVKVKVYP